MNIEDLPEESDSSDEDYVPDSKSQEILSEEESDGLPEDDLDDSETASQSRKKKRKQSSGKTTKKRKTSKGHVSPEINDQNHVESSAVPKEEKKQEIDDIWADFMRDTGFQSKSSSKTLESKNNETSANEHKKMANSASSKCKKDNSKDEKVKITQIFQFAGEEVKVEKEVAADSAQARLLSEQSSSNSGKPTVKTKKTGLSGIGSVLSQLGKKPKISTLEKTKLDWDKFKKEEKIEEEISTYNRGKDGYLEKQDFLQRADLRRFEIEKEVRSVERSRRLNNV